MGIGSPLSMLSSTYELPENTVPSAATFSPGFTSRMSPGLTCDIFIVFSPCPVTRVTVLGRSPAKRRIAEDVLRFALSSRSLPIRMKAIIIDEDSK